MLPPVQTEARSPAGLEKQPTPTIGMMAAKA